MSSLLREPILWVHLSGLVTLPFFLGLCLFFLAVGEPLFPELLEISIIVAIGTLPLLWMQLRRPFYIFAILGLAVKPEELTEKQRKILCLIINTKFNRFLALLSAVILIAVLWNLYYFSPKVASFVAFIPQWRVLGLLASGLAFLASNLFLQIPVSVARAFVTKDTEFDTLEPLPLERIKKDFTILGVRVNKILPQWSVEVQTED
ncbi:MAG: low-complexity tail membrane protein [Scytonematopsis contorta HA4267-MV1]|jgi:hypothetical protein|nr:low-complexity tail membrane protein [Scytonematopsis contorta HA4267-MV1]